MNTEISVPSGQHDTGKNSLMVYHRPLEDKPETTGIIFLDLADM